MRENLQQILNYFFTCNIVQRLKLRRRDERRDRYDQAVLRHLGGRGQHRQQDGEHRRRLTDTGKLNSFSLREL